MSIERPSTTAELKWAHRPPNVCDFKGSQRTLPQPAFVPFPLDEVGSGPPLWRVNPQGRRQHKFASFVDKDVDRFVRAQAYRDDVDIFDKSTLAISSSDGKMPDGGKQSPETRRRACLRQDSQAAGQGRPQIDDRPLARCCMQYCLLDRL
jgi:hypothetical protein